MTEEQAQKVLDEWQGVRPECLEGEAKKLFEAIMKIADERDKIEQEYDRDTHILQNQLDLANAKNIERDKIIDLMANHIATNDSNLCQYLDMTTKCKYYAGENGKICDECIKQYFENKAKEILNK
jgi:hypothetical protein